MGCEYWADVIKVLNITSFVVLILCLTVTVVGCSFLVDTKRCNLHKALLEMKWPLLACLIVYTLCLFLPSRSVYYQACEVSETTLNQKKE